MVRTLDLVVSHIAHISVPQELNTCREPKPPLLLPESRAVITFAFMEPICAASFLNGWQRRIPWTLQRLSRRSLLLGPKEFCLLQFLECVLPTRSLIKRLTNRVSINYLKSSRILFLLRFDAVLAQQDGNILLCVRSAV